MEQQNNPNHAQNNTRIWILIGDITCIFLLAFLILIHFAWHPSSTTAIESNPNNLAVEVNAVNNILTWGSFIVAVLTIAAAVFGITGFLQFRSSINLRLGESNKSITQFKTDISKHLNEIENETKESIAQNTQGIEQFQSKMSTIYADLELNSKEDLKNFNQLIEHFINDVNKRISDIETSYILFRNRMEHEDRYLEESNNSIFEAITLIASQIEDKTAAKRILNKQLQNTHRTTLYRIYPNDDEGKALIIKAKNAALLYFKANGTQEDVPYLEYVVNNDPVEEIRRMAIEVIGVINYRDLGS